MIVGLLLAAGRSSRFGGDKLLAPLAGRSVIRWSAEAVRAATDALVVVVPPESPDIETALAGLDATLVPHAGRNDGMASSMRAGIESLPPSASAVVIALGDQPLVSPDVVRRLAACWQATGAAAVVPEYQDGRGHPVLFDRACFAALCALTGDVGARDVLRSLGDRVARVDVAGTAPLDVDTPEALAAVARILSDAR